MRFRIHLLFKVTPRFREQCGLNSFPHVPIEIVCEHLNLAVRRLNALLKGKIDQFSLDALVNAATRAGLQVNLLVTAPKRLRERTAANP